MSDMGRDGKRGEGRRSGALDAPPTLAAAAVALVVDNPAPPVTGDPWADDATAYEGLDQPAR